MGFYISKVYSSIFVCAESIKHYISWNQFGNYTILDNNTETLLHHADNNSESDSDIIQITKTDNKYTILKNDDKIIDHDNRLLLLEMKGEEENDLHKSNNNNEFIEKGFEDEEDDINLDIDISKESKDNKQMLFNKNDSDII